jgi:4-amino-4-deoxy-L-arabinose transferase-like glycosyltransferase
MKNYKGILVWAIEIVTFLLAAFGGFLTKIAPPDQTGASFAVGIVSVVVLIVLLGVSAVGRQAATSVSRKRWIVAGLVFLIIALPSAFFYQNALSDYSYWYPPNRPTARHMKASDRDLTDLAKDYIARNPTDSCQACLELNLPADQIWKSEGMKSARNKLLVLYLSMVVFLATAIFCLIEANSPAVRNRQRAKRQNVRSPAPAPRGE